MSLTPATSCFGRTTLRKGTKIIGCVAAADALLTTLISTLVVVAAKNEVDKFNDDIERSHIQFAPRMQKKKLDVAIILFAVAMVIVILVKMVLSWIIIRASNNQDAKKASTAKWMCIVISVLILLGLFTGGSGATSAYSVIVLIWYSTSSYFIWSYQVELEKNASNLSSISYANNESGKNTNATATSAAASV